MLARVRPTLACVDIHLVSALVCSKVQVGTEIGKGSVPSFVQTYTHPTLPHSHPLRQVHAAPSRDSRDPRDSHEQAEADSLYHDPRERILEAALELVHKEGWTEHALVAGADSIGMPPVSHGMFPNGGFDLVLHFMRKANRETSEYLAELDLADMPRDEIIARGVQYRLERQIPFIRVWPQAMGLGALPPNAPDTLSELSLLVDELWWHAGDRSIDLHWYSRRGLLLAVYASTELFMLTDTSEGYRDTWDFLHRRLEDAVAAGVATGNASSVGIAAYTGVTALAGGAASLARPFFEAAQSPERSDALKSTLVGAATAATGAAASFLPPHLAAPVAAAQPLVGQAVAGLTSAIVEASSFVGKPESSATATASSTFEDASDDGASGLDSESPADADSDADADADADADPSLTAPEANPDSSQSEHGETGSAGKQ